MTEQPSPETRLMIAIFGRDDLRDDDLYKVVDGIPLKVALERAIHDLDRIAWWPELVGRNKRIMRLRFGLEDGEPRTLEAIGKEVGVNRERVRQIEGKGLRMLRHPSRSNKLRRYLKENTNDDP